MLKTVVVGLLLAFLLFTPQGRGIAMDAIFLSTSALGLEHMPPFGGPVQVDPWGAPTGSEQALDNRLYGCDTLKPECVANPRNFSR
jgi:hypothetical protein